MYTYTAQIEIEHAGIEEPVLWHFLMKASSSEEAESIVRSARAPQGGGLLLPAGAKISVYPGRLLG